MHAKFWLALVAVAVGLGAGGVALAADAPAQDQAKQDMVKQALAKDAVCTKCHDENDNKAILSIYQTRHGVKADSRTPGCQTCHGASDAHVKNPQGSRVRPSPDVVFGPKSATPVGEKNDACLLCHKSGARTLLDRQQPPVPRRRLRRPATRCTRRATRCSRKITQPDVCFDCHKTQRAQIHLISDAPDPRRQGRVLGLPQSARLDRHRS